MALGSRDPHPLPWGSHGGVVAIMSSVALRRSPERSDWVLLQSPQEAGSLSHGIGAQQAGWGI